MKKKKEKEIKLSEEECEAMFDLVLAAAKLLQIKKRGKESGK